LHDGPTCPRVEPVAAIVVVRIRRAVDSDVAVPGGEGVAGRQIRGRELWLERWGRQSEGATSAVVGEVVGSCVTRCTLTHPFSKTMYSF
jgi:hypothetical protein